MQINQCIVIVYIFFWVVRINGCIRRGRQPLLRGPEWFFNIPVQPGFYTGAGRKLLHRYWIWFAAWMAISVVAPFGWKSEGNNWQGWRCARVP